MSYVVLARKWRPQSFEDLVGQEHVSRTLESAIASNRVAHAFVFTGVRGVGKTTSARILAKALNCESGPTAKPCQTCSVCVQITSGADVDVQEIDGASYNGVDEVRRLQESLPYRPARDRFKIFIVDEVHMLSNAAWNAFLKTLEEPPPHVKFIFATTEVHKIPVTILSRCQRYDFKLISAQTIAARLRFVLEKEAVPADDAAVAILSREAAGSMRDAMSLLDQVIAWAGPTEGHAGVQRLTAESVSRVLGVAARSVLHEVAAALVDGDAARCLKIVGDLAEQGFDIVHVARDLLALLRDVVVAKVCADPTGLLDMGDQEIADVRSLAARTDVDDLTRLHVGFSRAIDDVARSGQPRAALEMSLVRLARRPPLLPVDELLQRLRDLERRLEHGRAPGGSAGTPSQGQGGKAPPRAQEVPVPPVRRVDAPFRASGARSEAARFSAHEPSSDKPPPRPSLAVQQPAPAPPPESENSPPASTADLAGWRAVLAAVHEKRPALASVLEHAALVAFGADRIVLAYPQSSFLVAHATEPAARAALQEAVRTYFRANTEVVIDVNGAAHGAPTVAQIETAERKARVEAARRAVIGHPLVVAAQELLGAELRDVRLGTES